jgi:hypothetical protein
MGGAPRLNRDQSANFEAIQRALDQHINRRHALLAWLPVNAKIIGHFDTPIEGGHSYGA